MEEYGKLGLDQWWCDDLGSDLPSCFKIVPASVTVKLQKKEKGRKETNKVTKKMELTEMRGGILVMALLNIFVFDYSIFNN